MADPCPMNAEEAIVPGTAFRTLRGERPGRVAELLGAGGQGAVFAAEVDGRRFALKWYHASYAALDTGLRARLLRAVERGPPNESFLWPVDLVEKAGAEKAGVEKAGVEAGLDGAPCADAAAGSFGYLMPLRDESFAGMRDLIAPRPRRIEPPMPVRAAICLNVAEGFLQLHSQGFCYQDVNFGNVFFHPRTGAVLVCDNDNVDVDGAPPTVFGTRKFMAPEVVRREAYPSTGTDLFSMAVLFFYVLHGWHPLDGRREAEVAVMDAHAEASLYGNAPVFLFDPHDGSNGPVAGMHEPVAARWAGLTSQLRGLFVRSFGAGLRDPRARVLEAEWRGAFAALALRDVACGGCGFEHALEADATGVAKGEGDAEGDRWSPAACPACGGPLKRPPVLRVGRHLVALAPGRQVPAFVASPDMPVSLNAAAAAVVEAHPQRPEVLGLRNRTGAAWRATLRDGSAVAVPPGSAVRLVDGARIEFAGAVGTVTVPNAARTREPA